jgi:hypothetical protein
MILKSCRFPNCFRLAETGSSCCWTNLRIENSSLARIATTTTTTTKMSAGRPN